MEGVPVLPVIFQLRQHLPQQGVLLSQARGELFQHRGRIGVTVGLPMNDAIP